MPSLSQEYRDEQTNQRWNVKAYAVEPLDPGLGERTRPWTLGTLTSGVSEFFINVNHPVFRSATMTPLDGLLSELAWAAMDFQRGRPSSMSFASVLASLRERYARGTALDPVALSNEARSILTTIARGVARTLEPGDSDTLFNELSPSEREIILAKMVARSVPSPQRAIADGRFLEFAPSKTLLRFFERHPELFLDGRLWDDAYALLDYGFALATEEAQTQIVRYYAGLLLDVVWLAEQDPSDLSEASRTRLLRSALALELLATTESEDEG